MIGTRKQWIKTLLMTITACLCFSYTHAYADPVFNELYRMLQTQPDNVTYVIMDYCNTVLGSNKAFVTSDNSVHNAKFSSFVYLLCSNVGSAGGSMLAEKYFVRTSFPELGIVDSNCTPIMNNKCDLSYVTSKIFNGIMNDYINMKQPTLYGLVIEYPDDTDPLGKIVNDYSTGYFGIALCNKNITPSYDKTCRMAKSYVSSVRNILSDVLIFDTKTLFSPNFAKDKGDIPCGSTNLDLNLFYCGLKDTGSTSLASFVDLLYNELYYYRVFVGMYMTMIQEYPPLYLSYSTINKKFASDYLWSKRAMSLSLRMMRDMYVAFPFHIGLSMYQENLDKFGKNLAGIAPPIYTLYDKLRNVQKPE